MGRIATKAIKEILERHPEFQCSVYIETGLLDGGQLIQASPCFTTIHGIELDKYFYELSKKNTQQLPHVTIHHGDTREILPQLLKQYAETPCFIYLDAHFCKMTPPLQKSEFPLWKELEVVRAKKTRDIVLVDDVHTFGVDRPDIRFAEGEVCWESVTQSSLLKYFGKRTRDSRIVGDSFVMWKNQG